MCVVEKNETVAGDSYIDFPVGIINMYMYAWDRTKILYYKALCPYNGNVISILKLNFEFQRLLKFSADGVSLITMNL